MIILPNSLTLILLYTGPVPGPLATPPPYPLLVGSCIEGVGLLVT